MHGKQSMSFWPFQWAVLCKHSCRVGVHYGHHNEIASLLSTYDSFWE